MLINLRNALMAGKRLSYIPIYGVYSDGIAYSILPHVHENAKQGKVQISFVRAKTGTYRDLIGKNFFGDSRQDSNHLMNNYNPGGTRNFEFQFYCAGSSFLKHVFSWVDVASPHTVIVERTTSASSLIVYDASGQQIDAKTGTATGSMTLGRLGLFTQNNAGPGDGINPVSGRVPKNFAITGFKYWDGDALIADLLPCVEKASSEVCFYNLVDRTFLKKATTSGVYSALYQQISRS